MMKDPELEVPKSTQYKVTLATIFGTFGLFAQAIYYLIITATRGYHQSTFLSLSILLVDEILPAIFFLLCLITLPSPREFYTTLTKSKKKTTGSGSGDTHLNLKSGSTTSPHSNGKGS